MKKTIICVVGASGSGKTTICRHMEQEYGTPTIVSFTTRPMRSGEGYGIDHHFVKPEQKPSTDDMLAYTKFGNYEYWVHKNQIDESKHDVFTYVIDEDGVRFLKEHYSDKYNIMTVYVERNSINIDSERAGRDKDRKPLNDYDVIISNNGNIKDVVATAYKQINNALCKKVF